MGRPERIRVTDLSEEVMEERWVREAAEVGKIDERVVADEVPCAVVAVSPASGISQNLSQPRCPGACSGWAKHEPVYL